MTTSNIYDPSFVAELFDEMSASYGLTNFVSSLGFCRRWRRQCVEGVHLESGMTVLDLMTGMGECWRFLDRSMSGSGRILALDISGEMCRRAQRNTRRVKDSKVHIWQDDALCSALPDACVDAVVASFGLKTFSPEQLAKLAQQTRRLLKPGGTFSFVEISKPHSRWLRAPYLFYLRRLIPILGRLFLGNPDNYRLLAVYTEAFADGQSAIDAFEGAGFEVRVDGLFFGCARRITGSRPFSTESENYQSLGAGLWARVGGGQRAITRERDSWNDE